MGPDEAQHFGAKLFGLSADDTSMQRVNLYPAEFIDILYPLLLQFLSWLKEKSKNLAQLALVQLASNDTDLPCFSNELLFGFSRTRVSISV